MFGSFVLISKSAGKRQKTFSRFFCPYFQKNIVFSIGNHNSNGTGNIVVQIKTTI